MWVIRKCSSWLAAHEEQRKFVDRTLSPVKKRTKSARSGPRKKRRSTDIDDDDDDAESDATLDDEDEAEASPVEVEEEEEAEAGETVVGRGGKRGAKVFRATLYPPHI